MDTFPFYDSLTELLLRYPPASILNRQTNIKRRLANFFQDDEFSTLNNAKTVIKNYQSQRTKELLNEFLSDFNEENNIKSLNSLTDIEKIPKELDKIHEKNVNEERSESKIENNEGKNEVLQENENSEGKKPLNIENIEKIEENTQKILCEKQKEKTPLKIEKIEKISEKNEEKTQEIPIEKTPLLIEKIEDISKKNEIIEETSNFNEKTNEIRRNSSSKIEEIARKLSENIIIHVSDSQETHILPKTPVFDHKTSEIPHDSTEFSTSKTKFNEIFSKKTEIFNFKSTNLETLEPPIITKSMEISLETSEFDTFIHKKIISMPFTKELENTNEFLNNSLKNQDNFQNIANSPKKLENSKNFEIFEISPQNKEIGSPTHPNIKKKTKIEESFHINRWGELQSLLKTEYHLINLEDELQKRFLSEIRDKIASFYKGVLKIRDFSCFPNKITRIFFEDKRKILRDMSEIIQELLFSLAKKPRKIASMMFKQKTQMNEKFTGLFETFSRSFFEDLTTEEPYHMRSMRFIDEILKVF